MNALVLLLLLQMPHGATNPNVTQANIHQTICRAGWTSTVRPSDSYTNKLKTQQMKARGLKGTPSEYEEDHFISLEIGGHPTDPANLWPQAYRPKPGAREKDQVEDYLHREVCAGHMTLAKAQENIRTDWLSIYQRLHVKK